MSSSLNAAQRAYLLRPDLDRDRVSTRKQSGRDMSYVEAWDIKRTLIRVFGFGGFSVDLTDCSLAFEQQVPQASNPDKMNWNVGYRAVVRLTIDYATYTEAAVGFASLPDRGEAHDMAMKTAESDALKRAAIYLGTQFGLGLYNNGSLLDVVKGTLDGNGPSARAGSGENDPHGSGLPGVPGSPAQGVRDSDSEGPVAPPGAEVGGSASGGVRGPGESNPGRPDPGPSVLQQGVRGAGAPGTSDQGRERQAGGGAQPDRDQEQGEDALPAGAPVQPGEHVQPAERGQVLPGVRPEGDGQVVQGSKADYAGVIRVAPVTDEEGTPGWTWMKALRELAVEPDNEARTLGVAALINLADGGTLGDGFLDEVVLVKDQQMTRRRLADMVRLGKFIQNGEQQ